MKTKRDFFLSLAGLLAVSILFLAGCGSGAGDKKANEEAADTINKELVLTPEAKNMLYELPTPFDVTNMLQEAQAGYIFDITNPIENAGKYMTEKSKALNLGIYSADLAYSATYRQIDNTNKFLENTSRLSDELGIAGIYQPDLFDKVKKFADNKDSLVALFTHIFTATNDFLSKNNRNQVSIYTSAGAFIEGLYLASSLNVVAVDNAKISAIIFAQADTYSKLMTIIKLYQEDEEMESVYNELLKLKPVFTEYAIEPGASLNKEKAAEIMDLIEFPRNTFIQ